MLILFLLISILIQQPSTSSINYHQHRPDIACAIVPILAHAWCCPARILRNYDQKYPALPHAGLDTRGAGPWDPGPIIIVNSLRNSRKRTLRVVFRCLSRRFLSPETRSELYPSHETIMCICHLPITLLPGLVHRILRRNIQRQQKY